MPPSTTSFLTFPGSPFELFQPYPPAGDQPTAIAQLVEGVRDGEVFQTLLGVTGSGKTFTPICSRLVRQLPAQFLTFPWARRGRRWHKNWKAHAPIPPSSSLNARRLRWANGWCWVWNDEPVSLCCYHVGLRNIGAWFNRNHLGQQGFGRNILLVRPSDSAE